MPKDWQELTRLTGGAPIIVERVRMPGRDIAIEGEFDLPPLVRLSAEDQVFIMAFVRSHGSIKEMERLFGISYPTVKNRLNRISESLQMVEIDSKSSHTDVLDELERGEITPDEAIERMSL